MDPSIIQFGSVKPLNTIESVKLLSDRTETQPNDVKSPRKSKELNVNNTQDTKL